MGQTKEKVKLMKRGKREELSLCQKEKKERKEIAKVELSEINKLGL